MKKPILILFILTCFSRFVFAQDFPYGSVSSQEMGMKNYAKDTSAHAVVLQEFGSSRINVAGDDELKLIFEYHVKIKIFDSKGFDAATAAIKIRNDESGNRFDELEKVEGTTYYKDNDGLIRQAPLDAKKIYTKRDYKYESTTKFTMPGLTDGCIIEYKYTVYSPFFLNHFRPWVFQSDIPKIYSEYHALIPGHFTYNAVLRGPLKLTNMKQDIERECFSTHGAKSDCSHITYIMSDIPAFVEEDYMTAPKNFTSAISFDLVEYINPYDGTKTKATKEWRDIDSQLKQSQEFGTQLKRKDLLKDRLVPVIVGKTDELEKAKAIYAYIQKWFKWNDYIGIYSSDGIKKAFDSHSGSIGDINICLIAALNGAGIKTEAALLSTRDNGAINDVYPAVNDFNYVVAKVNIGDKNYMLDATDPLLPFGMLPMKCLVDKVRIFSLDKPSYWMDLNLPQKESSSYAFDLTQQEDGKLKGTLSSYYSGYKAYKKRLAIKNFNTVDEYVEDLAGKLSKIKILKSEIIGVDSLNQPLIEKYEVEVNLHDKLDESKLSFNPFIFDRITTNPFKLAERSFPVDWGMPSHDRYVLTIHLSPQYTVETPPQKVAIAMPNDGGRFLTDYNSVDNTFTFSNVIEFNKSIYSPEEYPYLKELYNKIILSEKSEMVFKKK